MRQHIIALGTALTLGLGVAPAHADAAKAAEILAAARQAIGNGKLDALKALSVQASVQRNMGSMQMQTESELLVELPDKYVRTDVSSGPMHMSMTTGFNGDRAIMPAGASMAPGGGMVIRMGGGGAMANPHSAEKPTPEQQEQMNRAMVRNSRQELSRLLLGWIAAAHPSQHVQYTYAGEAESPDGKAYVIDVKDADGFAARLFIDQTSKLPLMLTYKGRQGRMVTNTRTTVDGGRVTTTERPQQMSEEEAKKLRADREKALADIQSAPMVDFSLFFEDWRDADGVKFPHVIRRASEGTTNEEWKVTKVKVNPKIDSKKFTVANN
jgi:hypothetical protein